MSMSLFYGYDIECMSKIQIMHFVKCMYGLLSGKRGKVKLKVKVNSIFTVKAKMVILKDHYIT